MLAPLLVSWTQKYPRTKQVKDRGSHWKQGPAVDTAPAVR